MKLLNKAIGRQRLLTRFLFIVHRKLAAVPVRDSLPLIGGGGGSGDGGGSGGGVVGEGVSGKDGKAALTRQWAAAGWPGEAALPEGAAMLVRAVLLRGAFGGMACDVRMLKVRADGGARWMVAAVDGRLGNAALAHAAPHPRFPSATRSYHASNTKFVWHAGICGTVEPALQWSRRPAAAAHSPSSRGAPAITTKR